MSNNYISLIDVKDNLYNIKDTSLHDILGTANGIATLDGTGKVPEGQLPIATTEKNGLMTKEDKNLLYDIPNQIIVDNLIDSSYKQGWVRSRSGVYNSGTASFTRNEDDGASYLYKEYYLEENQTYTVSMDVNTEEIYGCQIRAAYYINGTYNNNFDLGNVSTTRCTLTFTVPPNAAHVRLLFMMNNSSAIGASVTFSNMMLEIGSIEHKYQPYNLSRQKLREDIDNAGSGTDGSNVSVTQSLTSGTKVGTITVDGNATDLYAPTDTDTKVKQINSDLNNDYRVLLSNSANNIDETNQVRKSSSFTANPNTGAFYSIGYDRNDITGKTIDLDTLTLSAGSPECMKYVEKTDGGSANITNIPVTGKAFLLDVDLVRWASTTDFITRQIFTSVGDANVEYIRWCNKGTWTTWTKRLFTDNNTTYTNATLGQGYGTCETTEATTEKVATLSNYKLEIGGIVSIKFTYSVPGGSTLNINSKGAKAMFYHGSAIQTGLIKAGDIATFIYDGTQYHLLSTDTNGTGLKLYTSPGNNEDGAMTQKVTTEAIYGRLSSQDIVDSCESDSNKVPLSANQGRVLNNKIDGLRAHAYSLVILKEVPDYHNITFETYDKRVITNYDIISIMTIDSNDCVCDSILIPIAFFKKGYSHLLRGNTAGDLKVYVKYTDTTHITAWTSGTPVILDVGGYTLDNVSF